MIIQALAGLRIRSSDVLLGRPLRIWSTNYKNTEYGKGHFRRIAVTVDFTWITYSSSISRLGVRLVKYIPLNRECFQSTTELANSLLNYSIPDYGFFAMILCRYMIGRWLPTHMVLRVFHNDKMPTPDQKSPESSSTEYGAKTAREGNRHPASFKAYDLLWSHG